MNDSCRVIDLVSGPSATFVRMPKQPQSLGRVDSGNRRQISDSHQVVSSGGELEDPTYQLQTSVSRLAQQSHGFQPAKDLFHSFALALTNLITRMTSRALIDGAAATSFVVLGDMRRHPPLPQVADEGLRVIRFIRRQRHPLAGWPNNASAVSRSAVPLALVSCALTTKPWRFPISTCP
jgi:hypothetical protein